MSTLFRHQRGLALPLLALLLVLAVAWFGPLDYRKLVKPDEGRYAEIPREMAVTGDWVTPRLNGLKYFEKPALQYWATAAAYEAFGEHEWTVRLWPALTGFLGILLAAYTGRRLFGPERGWLAGAILGSSLLWDGIGHIATLDMGLSFFMEGALCGFLLANQPDTNEREARNWMLFTWAMLAFGTLSKGIVAPVLAGGSLVFYSILAWDFSPWRRLYLVRGLALFLAIAAPWFVIVSQKNPEFFHFFFIHEHFERFLTKSHARYHPWWYFVPVLVLGILPWLTFLPQAMARGWRRVGGGFQTRRFLLVWAVLIYLFFTKSDSKLPSYILPMFPALALLLADWLAEARPRVVAGHLMVLAVVAGAGIVAAPMIREAANPEQPLVMMEAYGLWIAVASGLWFIGNGSAALLAWRGQRGAALGLAALAAYLFGQGVMLGHENLAESNSAASLAEKLRPQLKPGVPFYSVGTYEQTLPFYIKRTVTLVDFGDEMTFGIKQEPAKAVATVEAFKARWNADKEAFALIRSDIHAQLEKDGLPMVIAARDLRRIVVKKPLNPDVEKR